MRSWRGWRPSERRSSARNPSARHPSERHRGERHSGERHPRGGRWSLTAERGSASLEFITAGLVLLVPLVYLVLAMSVLQGGAFAVEGAARQAARVFVQAPTPDDAEARVERAVVVGLADYGIDAADAQVSITCPGSTVCLSRRSVVTVTVRVSVELPFVPDVITRSRGGSIPLEASATQTVSRFWHEG